MGHGAGGLRRPGWAPLVPPATAVREARIGRRAWRPPMPLRLPA
jgi:hypothetical protein